MIWAILALVGVPLWLIAIALATLILRNRALRNRPGNIPSRMRRPGKRRFARGHGVWVHDVFAFRGSPAAWREALLGAEHVTPSRLTDDERHHLRRLGPDPFVALIDSGEGSFEVACAAEHSKDLAGPFVQKR
jgi:hypothetical protein